MLCYHYSIPSSPLLLDNQRKNLPRLLSETVQIQLTIGIRIQVSKYLCLRNARPGSRISGLNITYLTNVHEYHLILMDSYLSYSQQPHKRKCKHRQMSCTIALKVSLIKVIRMLLFYI